MSIPSGPIGATPAAAAPARSRHLLPWAVMVLVVEPREEAREEQRHFAAAIRSHAPAPRVILQFRMESHLLSYHLGPPLHTLVEWGELNELLAAPGPHFVVMPPDYPARLQELCRQHGILYVDDEVQAGIGRTGKMWAIEHYDGVEPDLVVSGKSLGGGLPLAGVTGRAEVMDAVPPGGLGGTFGGNPLSCAAAQAVLELVADADFLAHATELGETLRARLDDLASRHDDIGEVRGLGPMLAFEFEERTPDRAQAVVAAAYERGLILLSCGLYGNVIRMLAPLTIARDELEEGLAILEESLAA